jgi:hypothetical protein
MPRLMKIAAEQGHGTDALQRPLRFQARLMRVGYTHFRNLQFMT